MDNCYGGECDPKLHKVIQGLAVGSIGVIYGVNIFITRRQIRLVVLGKYDTYQNRPVFPLCDFSYSESWLCIIILNTSNHKLAGTNQ